MAERLQMAKGKSDTSLTSPSQKRRFPPPLRGYPHYFFYMILGLFWVRLRAPGWALFWAKGDYFCDALAVCSGSIPPDALYSTAGSF